jgi:hypothetical protein
MTSSHVPSSARWRSARAPWIAGALLGAVACNPPTTPDAGGPDVTVSRDVTATPDVNTTTPDASTPMDSGVRDATTPDPCAALSGCDACAAAPECGFCRSNNRCMTGSDTSSSDGTCRGASWAWTVDQCSMPDASTPDSATLDAARDSSVPPVDVSVPPADSSMAPADANPCPAGQNQCLGAGGVPACVNLQTDRVHCGMCRLGCVPTHACVAGACRPANDSIANATPVTLTTREQLLTQSTGNATDDGTGCSFAMRATVWFRVTLANRAVLYADTAESTYDTTIFLANATGAAITATCNDDASCPSGVAGGFTALNQSRFATVVDAGTYYVGVGGFNGATGALSLHLQQLPVTVGSYFYSPPLVGDGVTGSTALIAGSTPSASTCSGMSGEDVRWFMTCGSSSTAGSLFSLCPGDGGSFARANGANIHDPTLTLYSANTGAPTDCNDDGPAAANCVGTGGDGAVRGSRLTSRVPRGVAAVLVDDLRSASAMPYTMRHRIEP